ncbi:DNA topoisomerase 1-like [Conger conger]|uniref:DNA topoisomerase 1-like n=1 Tax=Conger conger TaxID=82655 RepID=UPI002A5AA92A|nr:DNA topoisomerase 1-like [Conger conger]
MKRKTNEDEDEPKKKTKNTVEQKELGPTKNPAEEKGINQKDLKKHLMKIKKQKEESRKQLKEAEYQKEMAKKQKKAAELLLKDLSKKEPKEAEFLKVWPKNEKIKDSEDEEELRKTSKDAVEQKGLGLKTHLMRIKKEKEAMRKELKEEELQKEMEKKLKELLKETTQKWQKQAELLTQVIREKDEAELQKVLKEAQNEARLKKEVIKKAEKVAGLREMINQEKVTEVELRKTSKDAVEQKGLGLNTHLMRIKKEKEAMRKEMIKGEKDWEKHELAQKLNSYMDQIQSQYYQDMDSAEMAIRQRAIALYFIDKLALSVGSEKEVSCSSLRVKNVTLHKDHDKNEYMVEFDFLSKDLIRSYKEVPVTKRVYKNLKNIIENKGAGDKLFDLLTTSTLNEYISSLMPGLTSEVFRTYNASVALQKSQRELSCLSNGQADKMLAYNGANHAADTKADTKDFEQSIAGLNAKIDRLTQELSQVKTELAVWDAKYCFDRKWYV